MHIIYIDESGTDPHDRYFVVAGICVPEEIWQDLDARVVRLKAEWFPWAKPEDVELKGHDILEGKEVFRKLKDRRFELFLRVSEIIETLRAKVIAVVVDKDALQATFDRKVEPIYRIAYWQLLDTANEWLTANAARGIMLMDSRSTVSNATQDRHLVEAYREYNAKKGLSQLVELPLFGFSHFYSALQLADFCAYAIRLSFKRQTETPLTVSPQRLEAEQVVCEKVRNRLIRLVEMP